MGRFLKGLNDEIAKVVELYSYHGLEELVAFATKVEKSLLRGESNYKLVVGNVDVEMEQEKTILNNH